MKIQKKIVVVFFRGEGRVGREGGGLGVRVDVNREVKLL